MVAPVRREEYGDEEDRDAWLDSRTDRARFPG